MVVVMDEEVVFVLCVEYIFVLMLFCCRMVFIYCIIVLDDIVVCGF